MFDINALNQIPYHASKGLTFLFDIYPKIIISKCYFLGCACVRMANTFCGLQWHQCCRQKCRCLFRNCWRWTCLCLFRSGKRCTCLCSILWRCCRCCFSWDMGIACLSRCWYGGFHCICGGNYGSVVSCNLSWLMRYNSWWINRCYTNKEKNRICLKHQRYNNVEVCWFEYCQKVWLSTLQSRRPAKRARRHKSAL